MTGLVCIGVTISTLPKYFHLRDGYPAIRRMVDFGGVIGIPIFDTDVEAGMGSAKDVQTMLRHTKPDTAQEHYVQPVEDSVRSAVDKLAATLLG